MSSSNNKRVEIIPVLNIPYSQLQTYTYSIPSSMERKIRVGQLVEIFFRRRKIKGVVIKIYSGKNKILARKPKIKLSPILRFDDSGIILSENQIKLAEFISRYYYVSLGLAVKTILPPVTRREPRKKIEFNLSEKNSKALERHCLANSKIKKLSQNLLKNKKTLFIHNLTAARHQIYLEIIKKNISKNRQVILLLPDFFDLWQFAGFYIKELREESVAILSSEITDAQFYQQWKKINDSKAKLIIGNRLAVFAPAKKLGLIIIDDEHSFNYKQWDQNPRYHARETALELAKITDSKIILSSPAPSLESFHRIKNKEKFILTSPNLSFVKKGKTNHPFNKREQEINIPLSKGEPGGVRIIDMNQERQKRNFSIFSDELKNSLIEQLNNKKQIILFVSRRGFHTLTLCQDCGYIAECPQCHSPLVSLQNKSLICYHCHLQVKALTKCPICQSVQIRSFGAGADKVEEEVKSVIYGAAGKFNSTKFAKKEKQLIRICRLDSGAVKNKKSQHKIYSDFADGKIDIMIGTQMVLKNWNLSNLGMMGIISADSFLNFPDFRSREKSFQILKQIILQTQDNIKIIVQTHHPENKVFKAILSDDLSKFCQQELESRKISFGLNYPPFSQIIKLIHKNKNARLGERNARETYRTLKNKIAKTNNKQFEITEPFPAFNYQVRGMFRWHIIIKSDCQNISLRDEILRLVGTGWIIDVDPESLS